MDGYIFYFTQKDSDTLGKITVHARGYSEAEKIFRLIYSLPGTLIHEVSFTSWISE